MNRDRNIIGDLGGILEPGTLVGSGSLPQVLDAAKRSGMTLADLTVLAPQNDPYRLDTPAHRRNAAWFVQMIGAGSFGAPAGGRPESTARLYNLLEIRRDLASARIHTRCQPKADGPWGGYYEWPDPDGGRGRVAFYDIQWEVGS